MTVPKKVLLIAPYFTPRRRVGALRPFKFAIHLSSLGYEPIVLTIGHKPDQLTPKERLMLKSIEIISIESPFDRTSGSKKSSKSVSNQKKPYGEKILSWIDRNCPVDTWIFLFLWRWSWIKRAVIVSNPDLIFASGDPWSGLWLGEKLARKLNVPFIADFRDPWTLGNQRLRDRSSMSAGIDRVIENKVIERADHLIFTSRQTDQLYSEKYQIPSGKSTTIYNSFEPGLMKNFQAWNAPEMEQKKFNILFLGRFRRLSSVSVVLDVLKQIQSSYPDEADWIRIHSFGEPDNDEMDQIQKMELSTHFLFHPPFEPEYSLQVMNSADLLLLSTSRQRSEIIPAKLWDYLFSEAPILSIVPNPEVGDIIMNTGAGIHFNPDSRREIAEWIIQAIMKKQAGETPLVSNHKDVSSIKKYMSRSAAEKLAELFDDLLKKNRN